MMIKCEINVDDIRVNSDSLWFLTQRGFPKQMKMGPTDVCRHNTCCMGKQEK